MGACDGSCRREDGHDGGVGGVFGGVVRDVDTGAPAAHEPRGESVTVIYVVACGCDVRVLGWLAVNGR